MRVRDAAAMLALWAALVEPGLSARAQAVKAQAQNLPIRVLSADSAPIRQRDVYLLKGNVKVQKDDSVLSAQRMTYDRRTELLTAEGAVALRTPGFDLSCDHLIFHVRENRGVAWGQPKMLQTLRADEAGKRSWIDLRAAQIKFYSTEHRISALEDVVLIQYDSRKAVTTATFRIRCRSMEALLDTHRNVFKGRVRVETPEVGARGDRVYFHQLEKKFYVVGNARAWNYDKKGKAINVICGNKIVHFFEERRSVVLGSVTASVFPDEETRAKPLVVDTDLEGSR